MLVSVRTPARIRPCSSASCASTVSGAAGISARSSPTWVSAARRERRPQLDQLLTGCRKRRFDAVVVYRYDRFARSLAQLVNALGEFDALGIQFVSLHERVDTSTPNGRLVFGIFASIAEFERELIRDRVRSGIAAARARGTRLGRPCWSVRKTCRNLRPYLTDGTRPAPPIPPVRRTSVSHCFSRHRFTPLQLRALAANPPRPTRPLAR